MSTYLRFCLFYVAVLKEDIVVIVSDRRINSDLILDICDQKTLTLHDHHLVPVRARRSYESSLEPLKRDESNELLFQVLAVF